MLGWDRDRFHKKQAGIHCAELGFLHLVGSTCHVVHTYTIGIRNVDALFFVLRWAQCGFPKKRARTHYTELVYLHPVGSVGHVVHSTSSDA
jgi:hypothetical protein